MTRTVPQGTVMATESSVNRTWYVYCHTAPNGKKYIGQTRNDPQKRWGNGRGYSTQPYFKRAIDKYGWDNIEHVVICSVRNQEYADFLERWFIEKWDTTNSDKGYNCAKGGAGPTGVTWNNERKQAFSEYMSGESNPMYGRHHSPEAITLMSKNRSGKKASPEMRELRTNVLLAANKRRRKPIRQLDLDGNVIKTYPGMGEMEAETGFNHSGVWKVCRGKADTAYGFKWEYVDDELREEAKKTFAKRPRSGTPVIQLDLAGNEIARFGSMTEAERETGLNRNKISACCFGEQDTYAGYVWRLEHQTERKKKNRPSLPVGVIQFDMDGREIARFSSLKQAMEATGHNRHRITECCQGKRDHYRECRWRYDESNSNTSKQSSNGLFS